MSDRAALELELLAELEADDDGGPVEPPTPPPVICPLCQTAAPVYLAMRCGDLVPRLEAHGPGYPGAPCRGSWGVVPEQARPAALSDPRRSDPCPAATARQRAEVAALPLFGGL